MPPKRARESQIVDFHLFFLCFLLSRCFGFPTLQDRPRGSQDRSKTAQEAPKRAPRRPKRAPRRSKRRPRRPKTAPKGAQEGELRPHFEPSAPVDTPDRQLAPKRRPRDPKEASKRPPRGPERLQIGSKRHSRSMPRDPNRHPRSLRHNSTWLILDRFFGCRILSLGDGCSGRGGKGGEG